MLRPRSLYVAPAIATTLCALAASSAGAQSAIMTDAASAIATPSEDHTLGGAIRAQSIDWTRAARLASTAHPGTGTAEARHWQRTLSAPRAGTRRTPAQRKVLGVVLGAVGGPSLVCGRSSGLTVP